jgi:hypothetical protein
MYTLFAIIKYQTRWLYSDSAFKLRRFCIYVVTQIPRLSNEASAFVFEVLLRVIVSTLMLRVFLMKVPLSYVCWCKRLCQEDHPMIHQYEEIKIVK